MTKKSIKAEFKNFVKGLITEASPVNFPPEASSAEENFELNRDGTRDRRLGLDFEASFNLRSTGLPVSDIRNYGLTTFEWHNVAGDPGSIFLVVQCGNVLHFYDNQAPSVSGSGYIGTITISSVNFSPYAFTAVDGRLIVAPGGGDLTVVTYTASTSTFSSTTGRISVRDVWGLPESSDREADPTKRTSTITFFERYNLYNQSWGIPRKNSAGTLDDPTGIYKTDLGVYPGSAETVWAGLQYQPVSGTTTPYERMFTNLYEEVLGATSNVARGYFIIDLLARGASRETAIIQNAGKYPQMDMSLLPGSMGTDYSNAGATVMSEFAGRVFYSGFNGSINYPNSRSPDLSNFVLFSQLVRSLPDIFKCYQAGDPTSRESSEVVDTDGGFVRINGADKIVALVNVSTSLLVFANNGVWAITGGGDYGFAATNFKVEKISDFGALGSKSIITDSGRVFYWSTDGIYIVGRNSVGSFEATNITQTTIQTHYESISNTAKERAIGVYDAIGKKVRWLYKEGTAFSTDSVTKELILDLTLNAFYIYRIMNTASNNAEVFGMVKATPFQSAIGDTAVMVGEDEVYSSTDQVLIPNTGREAGLQSTRYLCIKYDGAYKYTFGYYKNGSFADWSQVVAGGVDAKAFMQTGQYTADDSSIHKQIPYLTMHFKRTETGTDADLNPEGASSCLMRTMWDWANGYNSNKWGPLIQAYRYRKIYTPVNADDPYDNGFEVVSSRNKLRGRGKAFSLYFETEAEKDCRIIGWSLALNGNSVT